MAPRKARSKSPEIDAYLKQVAQPAKATLEALRAAIREALPDAEETISYSIPAFRRGGVVAGFAATASHCALYLFSGSITTRFRDELSRYDVSKGTVRFPPDRPLPKSLVKKLLRARVAEIESQ
jgi:uncharacterized protein YdhG (YjbR/CyaY superfamily)